MTSTASFKDKIKQSLALFKWDLKACSGTLAVFGILAGVLITIILTLCIVIGSISVNEAKEVTSSISSAPENEFDIFGASVIVFQYISSGVLYLMTTIFTIFHTVKIFSYLHNKRKADMYGSLPIGRITLYLTKTVCAYCFSIIPTLFFMGIITIISCCLGQPILNDVSEIYIKIIIGALACISAYGLISICCGTSVNSVIMFVAVCVVYPLSAIFIKGVTGGFFPGLSLGIFKDHFIMNALNPLAAYDGINIIYWIIFSIVCLVAGAFLIKKRKAERAQSSFAYYLPCHIIKVLIAFLAGMFLGVLFGSLNVLGYGFFGFIFGFILGSVPAFTISHLIFYKGFSKLIKTSIPLGVLIVVVVAGIAMCNYDIFGYNNFVPNIDNVKSVGLYDSTNVYLKENKSINAAVEDMCDDFDEKELKEEVISLHKQFIDGTNYDSNEKFIGVWTNMFMDNIPIPNVYPTFGISYRMNDGSIKTRIYSAVNNISSEIDQITDDSYDNTVFNDTVFNAADTSKIITQKKYIEKYSGIFNADKEDFSSFYIEGYTDNDDYYSGIQYEILNYFRKYESSRFDSEKIIEAFKKDFAENEEDFKKVMFIKNEELLNGNFYYNYEKSYPGLSAAQEKYPDIFCQIELSASSLDINDFNSFFTFFNSSNVVYSTEETYLIPKSFKRTIKAMYDVGIINKDGSFNEKCPYVEK